MSAVFDIQPGTLSSEVKAALNLIDAVHRDGMLPQLPLVFNQDQDNFGVFDPRFPMQFAISEYMHQIYPQELRTTVIHETGHFLDWSGIGTSSTLETPNAANGLGPMADWFKRVSNTPEVTSLIHIVNTSSNAGDVAYAEYLLQPWELWARSYTQYIAARSKDLNMAKSLMDIRTRPDYTHVEQWSPQSFKTIFESINALFKGLGWLS